MQTLCAVCCGKRANKQANIHRNTHTEHRHGINSLRLNLKVETNTHKQSRAQTARMPSFRTINLERVDGQTQISTGSGYRFSVNETTISCLLFGKLFAFQTKFTFCASLSTMSLILFPFFLLFFAAITALPMLSIKRNTESTYIYRFKSFAASEYRCVCRLVFETNRTFVGERQTSTSIDFFWWFFTCEHDIRVHPASAARRDNRFNEVSMWVGPKKVFILRSKLLFGSGQSVNR